MKNQIPEIEPVIKHKEVIWFKRNKAAIKRYQDYKFTKDKPNPNWSNTGIKYSEYLELLNKDLDATYKDYMQQRLELEYT